MGSELDVKAVQGTFFEILRKRYACRQFDPRPVPDELLDVLVRAAHRAPTAGNATYRFVLVVKNPTVLKMVRLVGPGFLGECKAAIFICTDMDEARKSGRTVIDEITKYDAGAAAENVILAAYSIGLAGSFVKSYSEAAVSRLLELPAHCRTELLVSVGYPARDAPRPLKKKKSGKKTYLDKFGEPWKAAEEKQHV